MITFDNEIKKINLATELLVEITTFIPFHKKWEKTRISKVFDIFIFKIQKKISVLLRKFVSF